jgi:hypothetical protein
MEDCKNRFPDMPAKQQGADVKQVAGNMNQGLGWDVWTKDTYLEVVSMWVGFQGGRLD